MHHASGFVQKPDTAVPGFSVWCTIHLHRYLFFQSNRTQCEGIADREQGCRKRDLSPVHEFLFLVVESYQ
jgi:hypothetical protein